MFTAAYSCRFTGCNQGYADLRTSGMRRTELLHSLTVKLTETFPALRQAAEEKKKEEKKKRKERERERGERRLGRLPDAAYRWRATCWYSRSIHTCVGKIVRAEVRCGRGAMAEGGRCNALMIWPLKTRGFFPPFLSLLKRLLGFHTVMPIICAHREPGTPCAWFIQQWRANGESWGGREEGETGHHEVIQSSRITNTPGQQLIMSFNHGEHPCQATKQRVFNTKRKKKQQQKKTCVWSRAPWRGETR